MKITQEEHNHLTVLAIQGDFTAEHTPVFRQTVLARLAANCRDFVLNLAQTDFVDSQALESLLWLQEQAGEKLGQVRLACLGENVHRILYVTRLLPRFDLHPDVSSAIQSLRV